MKWVRIVDEWKEVKPEDTLDTTMELVECNLRDCKVTHENEQPMTLSCTFTYLTGRLFSTWKAIYLQNSVVELIVEPGFTVDTVKLEGESILTLKSRDSTVTIRKVEGETIE